MKMMMTMLFPVQKPLRFTAAVLGAFYLLSVPFVIAQDEPEPVAQNKPAEVVTDTSAGVETEKPSVKEKEKLSEKIARNMPETLSVDLKLGELRESKPNHFHSWSERADYIQATMDAAYNDSVVRIDKHYGTELDEQEILETERSSFKLGTELTIEQDGGLSMGLDYDFDTEIDLPRLEKKAKLFVRTGDLDELPSSTISERDNGFQVGISRASKLKQRHLIDNAIGVKVKWLPVLFAESKIRRRWDGDTWVIYPQQKFYWESDDGFGEVTSMSMTKWLTDQWVLISDTGARWTEKSDGVEWDQSVTLSEILASLVEGDRKSDLFYAHKARGIQFSVFGHHDGHNVMDRYRLSLRFRKPIYKKWVYLHIIPEINWRDENEWDTDPGVRIGVELIFGDFYSRYRN